MRLPKITSQILMIRGNASDFIDHPLPKQFVSAHGASHHAWVPGPHRLNRALHPTYISYQIVQALGTMSAHPRLIANVIDALSENAMRQQTHSIFRNVATEIRIFR